MKRLISKLEYFNFSEMEANIYLTLLKHGELNGSQVSKILSCSRSAVYDCLKSMHEKGVILQIAGDIKVYKARIPEVLMEEIKQKCIDNAELLKNDLKNISKVKEENEYWNVKGEKNFISKAKELLNEAEKEVYINTNFSLDILCDELKKVLDRKVRIILFSFIKHERSFECIESFYRYDNNTCNSNRMMMVVDNKKTLVASSNGGDQVIGTFTENPLMAKIIAEHIHHDIYITKLEEKYGKDIIDKSIQIGTDFEKHR